jgi:hypothetical protein
VIGECNGVGAAAARTGCGLIGCGRCRRRRDRGAEREETALRVDVANAVRRLRNVDEDGRIPARGLRERLVSSATA